MMHLPGRSLPPAVIQAVTNAKDPTTLATELKKLDPDTLEKTDQWVRDNATFVHRVNDPKLNKIVEYTELRHEQENFDSMNRVGQLVSNVMEYLFQPFGVDKVDDELLLYENGFHTANQVDNNLTRLGLNEDPRIKEILTKTDAFIEKERLAAEREAQQREIEAQKLTERTQNADAEHSTAWTNFEHLRVEVINASQRLDACCPFLRGLKQLNRESGLTEEDVKQIFLTIGTDSNLSYDYNFDFTLLTKELFDFLGKPEYKDEKGNLKDEFRIFACKLLLTAHENEILALGRASWVTSIGSASKAAKGNFLMADRKNNIENASNALIQLINEKLKSETLPTNKTSSRLEERELSNAALNQFNNNILTPESNTIKEKCTQLLALFSALSKEDASEEEIRKACADHPDLMASLQSSFDVDIKNYIDFSKNILKLNTAGIDGKEAVIVNNLNKLREKKSPVQPTIESDKLISGFIKKEQAVPETPASQLNRAIIASQTEITLVTNSLTEFTASIEKYHRPSDASIKNAVTNIANIRSLTQTVINNLSNAVSPEKAKEITEKLSKSLAELDSLDIHQLKSIRNPLSSLKRELEEISSLYLPTTTTITKPASLPGKFDSANPEASLTKINDMLMFLTSVSNLANSKQAVGENASLEQIFTPHQSYADAYNTAVSFTKELGQYIKDSNSNPELVILLTTVQNRAKEIEKKLEPWKTEPSYFKKDNAQLSTKVLEIFSVLSNENATTEDFRNAFKNPGIMVSILSYSDVDIENLINFFKTLPGLDTSNVKNKANVIRDNINKLSKKEVQAQPTIKTETAISGFINEQKIASEPPVSKLNRTILASRNEIRKAKNVIGLSVKNQSKDTPVPDAVFKEVNTHIANVRFLIKAVLDNSSNGAVTNENADEITKLKQHLDKLDSLDTHQLRSIPAYLDSLQNDLEAILTLYPQPTTTTEIRLPEIPTWDSRRLDEHLANINQMVVHLANISTLAQKQPTGGQPATLESFLETQKIYEDAYNLAKSFTDRFEESKFPTELMAQTEHKEFLNTVAIQVKSMKEKLEPWSSPLGYIASHPEANDQLLALANPTQAWALKLTMAKLQESNQQFKDKPLYTDDKGPHYSPEQMADQRQKQASFRTKLSEIAKSNDIDLMRTMLKDATQKTPDEQVLGQLSQTILQKIPKDDANRIAPRLTEICESIATDPGFAKNVYLIQWVPQQNLKKSPQAPFHEIPWYAKNRNLVPASGEIIKGKEQALLKVALQCYEDGETRSFNPNKVVALLNTEKLINPDYRYSEYGVKPNSVEALLNFYDSISKLNAQEIVEVIDSLSPGSSSSQRPTPPSDTEPPQPRLGQPSGQNPNLLTDNV